METVKVLVGKVVVSSGGVTSDTTRNVVFEAEELAELRQAGTGRNGGPTDTRGTIQTLYKTSDGRLIVHVEEWSHWQGEPNVYTLQEVNEADLTGDGAFALLGQEAGGEFGRPLTLDEAIENV